MRGGGGGRGFVANSDRYDAYTPGSRLRYYRRVPLRLPISPTFSGSVRAYVRARVYMRECVRACSLLVQKKKNCGLKTRTRFHPETSKRIYMYIYKNKKKTICAVDNMTAVTLRASRDYKRYASVLARSRKRAHSPPADISHHFRTQ